MTHQPALRLLGTDLVDRILDEAFQLLMDPGIKIQNAEARALLQDRGPSLVLGVEINNIPERVVRLAR